jgi:ABC-type Fe3+-siderophore transport system permease subunit
VIVVLHMGEIVGLLTLPIAAFIGALLSMFLVLGIANRRVDWTATACCCAAWRCRS